MLTEFRHGALHVVQNVHDRHWITRLLREIDPALFLELQLLPNGERVWCVVHDLGLGQVPVTVYEARGSSGEPMPQPTEWIVEEFRRRAQDGTTASDRVKIAADRNKQRVEASRVEARESFEDIQRDFARLARTAPCLPRKKKLMTTAKAA